MVIAIYTFIIHNFIVILRVKELILANKQNVPSIQLYLYSFSFVHCSKHLSNQFYLYSSAFV